jgi:hypothetical protein
MTPAKPKLKRPITAGFLRFSPTSPDRLNRRAVWNHQSHPVSPVRNDLNQCAGVSPPESQPANGLGRHMMILLPPQSQPSGGLKAHDVIARGSAPGNRFGYAIKPCRGGTSCKKSMTQENPSQSKWIKVNQSDHGGWHPQRCQEKYRHHPFHFS